MKALDLAFRHPVAVMVAMLGIAFASLFAVSRMRTDVFPDLNLPVIYVAQPYGGMDPAQMEGLISSYYEYAFLYMNGIDHVESRNIQNLALLKLYFHPGTNMAQAMAEAGIYANRAKAYFPPGTVTPFIIRLDASSVPVAYLTLSSESRAIKELSDLMLFRLRPILASLPGASAPQPFGGSLRSIIVSLDPERLRAYNLSPQDVASALSNGNIITPSGNARIKDQMPIVSVNSIVVDPQDLGNIPIKVEEHVYLRDLLKGKIEDGMDIPSGWALVNGRRAVYMPILKTGDASTLTVVNELKENLAQMQSVLPEDVKLSLEFDQSPYVTGAVSGVVEESALGALLTGLMVLLFLRDWRSVIVVVLTIPLALMGAVVGLWATGQTINLMTLGGLSLAVGILVDEGTVVIENIHSQMEIQPTTARAILVGTSETMVPNMLAMLCILAVFLPSFLMEGAARGLFVPLAISVGFAMITAFALSITFVPVLSVWLLKHIEVDEHQVHGTFSFETFRLFYARTVGRILPRRKFIVPIYLVIMASLLVLFGSQVGREIAPQVDSGQFQMRIKAPTGTRLELTEELTRESLEVIKDVVGEENLAISVAYVGTTAPTYTANAIYLWTSGTDQAVVRVALKKDSGLRVEAIKERLRTELNDRLSGWLKNRLIQYGISPELADQRITQLKFSFEPADVVNQVMSFGASTPIEVAVSGPFQTENRQYAEKVAAKLSEITSLRDLQFVQANDYPRIKVEVDRERAGLAGLTVSEAASSLIAATYSSRYANVVFWADPTSGIGYQVQVQVPPARMNSMAEVGEIPVKSTDEGGLVLLRDVARIEKGTMPEEYDRINQKRMVTLTANVVGEDLGRAADKIAEAIKEAGDAPRGAKIEVRGQVPPMLQMFSGLATGLGLAVIVVFLMLTAYFQSLRLALVSVATTPAVVAGVSIALYSTGTTLNIESFMGAIMAIGVAVANAILLVTFAERDRQAGVGSSEAARTGAEERLRPILMTSCAMIAGMVPMALGMGEGGEQTAPLGRAVIGGLLFATFTTLLVLPAVFAIVMHKCPIGSSSLDPDDPESKFFLTRRLKQAKAKLTARKPTKQKKPAVSTTH
ncbi:efflux RND transporter permease subunit [Telmatocola sphagniphila]|uniref:Efflux RND transporter permease subunit n=1 Tax=Telmatocola sphagniphila TaxID=1123043 RepID=A0A8E6B907_9BACT|nr:efflux RND transporter permease subunit [Telmatocola sphagniphila]QVL34108.1 efflux RND transporter permease subunit [Telmatocola sphagniphila]